jgi:hypothetical protein
MVVSRILLLFQLCLLLYTLIAIVYTTQYFLTSPLNACFYRLARLHPWSPFTVSSLAEKSKGHDKELPNLAKEVIFWNSSSLFPHHGLDSDNVTKIPMTQDLFLSKAFSQSMKPSNIIPFFYRASGVFDDDDITITTLITSNRFEVVTQLIERYEGL